ncbi:MAG: hypothetical protein A2144_14315 [Chloroflexi bacterium RBG_16_50_9]|nr:MAG: hypothetical protein A2144_14315 [Chloroflexi bacterium RBG_16_50_9]
MKRVLLIVVGILALLSANVLVACTSQQPDQATQAELTRLREQNKVLKELAGPLPASLDNYFPPKAPAPVWLFEMFALEGAMSGIMGDLQQGDIAGVEANYQAFKGQYEKISGMVPEWQGFFPMEPVENLGKAINSGDPSKIGPAFGPVGEVCGNCHIRNMVKAHQKYHWPSFDTVKLTNPLSNQAVSWKDYMFQLSGTFSGIGNDLRQGQLENARNNFQAFSATFKNLPQGCAACHTTPRAYFVDPSVQALVDQLGRELAAANPDAKKVEELSGAIGNESCMNCHLVHFPAPNTKARWERFSDIFK